MRWDPAEVDRFVQRAAPIAAEVIAEDSELHGTTARELVMSLLRRIALTGNPHNGRPVSDLTAWARGLRGRALRELLAGTAPDGPQRRGDIVTIRSKSRWHDLRSA